MSALGRIARGLRRAPPALWRRATARRRALPDFLIIGAQKGGTTALYSAIARHPAMGAASRKEVHYLDLGFRRGPLWYRSHFPRLARRGARGWKVTGEATPYYLYHPRAPERAAATVPEARLIAMLRDPVDRAYSHYQHERRGGRETLEFEAALDAEAERLRGEVERLEGSEDYYSLEHHRHSYLDRGRYAVQLERWLRNYPRDRVLVLRSEDFFGDPARVLAEVLEFLGLDPRAAPAAKRENVGVYSPLDAALRARVADRFRADNQRLRDLLGRDFGWDAGTGPASG